MIPYGRQCIDEDDIEAVAEVLRSDFLTTGPKVHEFEMALCDLTNADNAIACSNGTTALHLAALALGIGEGDAVIVPSLTFLATANAVRYCGAEVVFADVNPQTALMEAHHLAEAMKRAKAQNLKVKAVFPVHMKGQSVNLKALREEAEKHGLKIMVDGAHAVGGHAHDHPIGAGEYEDMTTFSFHPVKTIAAGEGGAIVTNNHEYAKTMRELRSHGMKPLPEQGPWMHEMSDVGYNYRIPDILCALVISQMSKIERFTKRRAEFVALYNDHIEDASPFISAPVQEDYCQPAWHLYAPQFDFEGLGIDRANVMTQLKERGVGTQVHYIPVHTQPYYKNRYGELALPGAEQYYAQTLSLPLFPSLNDEDVIFVIEQLKELFGGQIEFSRAKNS